MPDPSSQAACTVGGNVGENAGGPAYRIEGDPTSIDIGVANPNAHGQAMTMTATAEIKLRVKS